MVLANESSHKAGAFKQQNKTHKTGRHRSKTQLRDANKGRVAVKTLSKHVKKAFGRDVRKNQLCQIRKYKREEILGKKRLRGSHGSPPFLVAVVALDENVDIAASMTLIKTCDDDIILHEDDLGMNHISISKFKQRFSFVNIPYGDLYAMLDVCRIADSVMLLQSAERNIDEMGQHLLSCLFAQGLPAPLLVIQGLNNFSFKKQVDIRKSIQNSLTPWFTNEKLHSLDSAQDGLLVVRTIGNQKMRQISMRDYRPHLIAEHIAMDVSSEGSDSGTLCITGYLRGQSLSANDLMHLPQWGDYKISKIELAQEPIPLKKEKSHVMKDAIAPYSPMKLLEEPDQNQQSLVSENDPDPMEGEQTWPTEEELLDAEKSKHKKQMLKNVPKGTSTYQAAWIIDSDEGEISSDEDDCNMEEMIDEESSEVDNDEFDEYDDDDEEYETISIANDDAKYDAEMDMDEEALTLSKYKAAKENELFPDEIDTPFDEPARTRFQKYRGLKSFRTSPWDAKENLPLDYARIFKFSNFRNTKKRILSDAKSEAKIIPGFYVTIHISDVPTEFLKTHQCSSPIIAFGLLHHEQKMSVVHFLIKTHPNCDKNMVIKSKERMVFHVGYRQYYASPLYSQHTNGNKHKFERYLGSSDALVATVIAPIIFSPASVLMFKEESNGKHTLVASGSVLSVDPDRIIIKRTVVSGHPYKINKRSAVVRYMFFNREDINWFKPIELKSKYGRKGHIKMPIGTHGHMKCIFDKQLTSMDTVMMTLYKRVFPKWTYECSFFHPQLADISEDAQKENDNWMEIS